LGRPIDFQEPIKRNKSKYGIGVVYKPKKLTNKFEANITWEKTRIYIGVFNTANEANQAYIDTKLKLEKEKEEKRLTQQIKRNNDGDAIIELFNKNKQKVGEATIDDHRYYDTTKHGWYLDVLGYVNGYVNGKSIRLHSYLMDAQPGHTIDHIDRNPLNNKIENLRFSTPALNGHNKTKSTNATSGYYGVSYRNRNNVYTAQISTAGKTYQLGRFKTEMEAAKAYDMKAKELYGTFANLNFP
jgi:hypothetical protein